MITKIDHIGIAVKDLKTAISTYESFLGLKCDHTEEIPNEQVRVAILRIGETKIELLQPTDEDSPVASFIRKRGEGIHHIAFETTDLEGQLVKAKDAGCRLIREEPKEGAGGSQFVFIHPASTHGVLLELCGKK